MTTFRSEINRNARKTPFEQE